MDHPAPDDARAHLWSLIKDIRFGMLVTRHSNGHLHSRPMTTQTTDLDEGSTLYFFLSRGSDAAADVAVEPSVGLTYADPSDDRYVAISGRASLVDDRAMKEQLWSKMAQAWFPGGVDDPDLALLKLDITHADYWDVKESKMVQLWRMATAAATGKPPTDLGEHERVQLR
jgi:general stress protein 26